MEKAELVKEAWKAREMAYAPYSHYKVGAALLTKGGKVYRGCNIENASYTPTNCAERTAFFKAVSEGEREFEAIAIVGCMDGVKPNPEVYASPCGVCRQVMREFTNPEHFEVIVASDEEHFRTYTLEQMLPQSFGPEDLLG
ncbi:MAG: cytidine deaminase [Lachnospiraceae bacterium]|jgi:cytidine deaminase|nr:cytidine deaminase [Lachnospiraceae bacterium]